MAAEERAKTIETRQVRRKRQRNTNKRLARIIRRLEVSYCEPESLKPYQRNARTHPPQQIDQIEKSIQQFGFTNPILIDENNEVIAGHGRLLAALQCGMKKVPVIYLRGLSTAAKSALRLADNKIAEKCWLGPRPISARAAGSVESRTGF